MNKSRGDDRFLRDRELSGALSSPLLQRRPAHGGSRLERLNEAAFTASHPVASSPLSYSLWPSSFSSSSYSLLSSLNLLFYYSISTNGISCLISYSQFSPFHFNKPPRVNLNLSRRSPAGRFASEGMRSAINSAIRTIHRIDPVVHPDTLYIIAGIPGRRNGSSA